MPKVGNADMDFGPFYENTQGLLCSSFWACYGLMAGDYSILPKKEQHRRVWVLWGLLDAGKHEALAGRSRSAKVSRSAEQDFGFGGTAVEGPEFRVAAWVLSKRMSCKCTTLRSENSNIRASDPKYPKP